MSAEEYPHCSRSSFSHHRDYPTDNCTIMEKSCEGKPEPISRRHNINNVNTRPLIIGVCNQGPIATHVRLVRPCIRPGLYWNFVLTLYHLPPCLHSSEM